MENYVGKICPFCKTEIRENEAVTVCPACGIAHHTYCWETNKGCTTFGCSEQHYEEPAPAPAPTAAPTAAPAGAVCPRCGAPMGADQAFCPMCGTAKPAAPQKHLCSKCGTELADGQVFCPRCGQKADLTMDPGVSNAIDQFNAGVDQQSKKKSKLPIILAVVAVVVVLALVLLLRGPSVDSIVLSESSISLNVDDSVTVSYTINPDEAEDVSVTWKSSDEDVATVNRSGKITGKGEGTCTITVTAGGKSDSVKVTVKDGPDFYALYMEYCDSTWAEYGSDGSYLSLDTNPYDWDDDGVAYPDAYYAITYINEALGLPSSLINDMGQTSAADGKQVEEFPSIGVTVSWKYHPDKGLEVTYKRSN